MTTQSEAAAVPTEPTTPDERADNPLRMLSISANLMPSEIVDTRRDRRVRRIAIAVLAGFAVVVLAWYGQARYQTTVADHQLKSAKAVVDQLVGQQRQYAEVVAAQAESQAITSQLAALFANDLPWSSLLATMQAAAPSSVHLSGVLGTLNATAAVAGNGAVQLPRASTDLRLGTLSITGSAPSKLAISEFIDALAKVKGLADPLLGDAVNRDGRVRFTLRVDIVASALGGRYAAKPTPSGG